MHHIFDAIEEARQVRAVHAHFHKGPPLVQKMSMINITQNLT